MVFFSPEIGIKNLVMMYDSSVFFCTPCDDAEGMTGDDAAEGLLMSDEKKVFIFDHRSRLQLAAVERRKLTCFAPDFIGKLLLYYQIYS